MPETKTERKDHPAAVIEQMARTSTTGARTFAQAAAGLRSFERTHGLTFEALDVQAFARVREVFASTDLLDDTNVLRQSVLDLRSAVCDLLGLE